MDCTFASDNTSGVHPKVMEALNKANEGAAEPYGDDPWTAEAEGCFKALFGDDVDVFSSRSARARTCSGSTA